MSSQLGWMKQYNKVLSIYVKMCDVGSLSRLRRPLRPQPSLLGSSPVHLDKLFPLRRRQHHAWVAFVMHYMRHFKIANGRNNPRIEKGK